MLEERPEVARQNLLKEMRDICFILTRKPWTEGLEYKLYDVLLGNTESFEGKPLAAALLSHIDALGQLSDEAGGWFTGESTEAFVDVDAWEEKFGAWKKG